MRSNIKLTLLKEFAKNEMTDYSITRGCILVEPRDMPIDVFLSKLRLWLPMLKIERNHNDGNDQKMAIGIQ